MPPRKIFVYNHQTRKWTAFWREDEDYSGTGYDTPVSDNDYDDLNAAEWELEEPL